MPRFSKWNLFASLALCLAATHALALEKPLDIEFTGKLSYHPYPIKELNAQWPSDWSAYSYLVLEMKTTTPQRFLLFINTKEGPRRICIQPFGQNVWLRASIPLQYFKGMDQSGNDLASTINRRTDSFWMSVWGPFGDLKDIQSLGIMMEYPVDGAKLEIRSMELAKEDPGSDFLEGKPVLDEFNQWAHADWPHKIHSQAQLDKELADEAANLKPEGFDYSKDGGYLKGKQLKATGFFRVEKVDDRWWFVDPEGHEFISTGVNGVGGGFGGRGGRGGRGRGGRGGQAATTATATAAAPAAPPAGPDLTTQRLRAWGMTTGGAGSGMPYTQMLRWPRTTVSYLGMSDVYDEGFAQSVEQSAEQQCTARKDDPLLIGYFIGNEPPWAGRESELADLWLKGADCATKTALKKALADGGDTTETRKAFMYASLTKYFQMVCGAIKKNDPNHLIIGTRFGGEYPDEMLKAASIFDVCSINVYEFEPTKQVKRAYEISGRPVLIGEFHFGVPADGLGAGLVQTRNQVERGKGYRYYVEQAAALPGFLGAHWFTWRDEPVLGRGDGENYNIGFIDATNRPYPELVEAAKATHRRLLDVHSGKEKPFAEKPQSSAAGSPDSPWETGWKALVGAK